MSTGTAVEIERTVRCEERTLCKHISTLHFCCGVDVRRRDSEMILDSSFLSFFEVYPSTAAAVVCSKIGKTNVTHDTLFIIEIRTDSDWGTSIQVVVVVVVVVQQ